MLTRTGKLLFCLFVLLSGSALNFVASVSSTEVRIGDPLLLTLSVEGENIGPVPAPQLPDLPGFDIGGTSSSQSTSIQIAGGKTVRRQLINFIHTLYPRAAGETVIGPCRLEFGGETYETEPIAVRVIQAGQSTPPKTGAPPLPQDPGPGTTVAEDLRLVAAVNRRTVYVGEPVIVEYTLYTRLRLADINLAAAPSFSGFWVEPIYDAQRIEFQRKPVDGKVYDYCVLKKSALFPMTSGRLQVAPMKLDVAVVRAPRDFFDVFSRPSIVPLQSEVYNIDVIPLPEAGKPGVFTGGVGSFTISAALDRTVSEAAEPIDLTIRITGSGNIKLIERPLIPSVPGLRILDPETRTSVEFSGTTFRGYKEFRYPLIPQTDGEHVVPAIVLAYFDPADREYHTVATERLKFTATQTSTPVETAQTGGLRAIGADVRYIKPDVKNLRMQGMFARHWLWLPYVACLLMIVSALIYQRHQTRLINDRAYARKTRSSRLLRSRMKEAENELKKGNEKGFYGALSRVLLGYIGDRYNLDVGSLTTGDLIGELEKRGVSADNRKRLSELLMECDLRFLPETRTANPRLHLQKARDLISDL